MTEKLLQFIWQNQYFNSNDLVTTNDEPIELIKQGFINYHQGPDFLNASIKISGIQFFGNIELHTKSSNWKKHAHSSDSNYNNVILHVVWIHDDTNIDHVATIELQHLVPKVLLEKYHFLMNQKEKIPCNSFLPALSEIGWLAWKERLLAERLMLKSEEILMLFNKNNNNWEETFWQQLAYNFGLKVNADFFKSVATSLPINILAKNKNQLLLLEALLFGQANLLNEKLKSPYANTLYKEYEYLKKKYQLKKVEGSVYFLRMRPSNFPTIRIAQLAALIKTSSHLFSKIKSSNNISEVKKLFKISCSEYWNTHYTLHDEESPFKKKIIGEKMIDLIIINTIVPMVFSVGEYYQDELVKTKAIKWLQEIKAEDNSILQNWKLNEIEAKSAFDSQALLQLSKNYCNEKKCLQCAVGSNILKSKI
jgi:hypothetical protein